jgi:uncharacterized OB-fold protein
VASSAVHSFKSPAKTAWAQKWWQGAANGVLVLQTCEDCDAINHPPGPVCTTCLSSNLTHREASGLGEIYSYTVTTRPMHAEFAADAPYTIVYVVLDEGLTIVSWLQGAEPEPSLVGKRVRVVFEQIDDETWLHRFVLDG